MSSDLHKILEAAGVDPNTLGPFAGFLQAVDAVVRARSAEAGPARAPEPERLPTEVDPWKLYTSEQAATILGLKDADTVTRIDEADLPKRWVGPSRGALRYLGADLLCYALGLPPVDPEPLRDRMAERLGRTAPTVQALPSAKGRKRLL